MKPVALCMMAAALKKADKTESRALTPDLPRCLVISMHSHVYGDKGHRANTDTTCRYCCKYVGNDDPENAHVVQTDITHGGLPPWKKKPNQRWIGHYAESPEHRGDHPFDEKYMANFDYTRGFHPSSTFVDHLFLPGNRWAEWNKIMTRGDKGMPTFAEKSKNEMMSVWITNCGWDQSHRLRLLKALVKYGVTIASFGGCENNKGHEKRDKVQESTKYRFMFAAENSRYPNYHSEKLFHAYMARTLPIYVGSRTIEKYVPAGSYIFADDFQTDEALAKHIIHVANNETYYNSYFDFEKQPLPPHVVATVEHSGRTEEKQDCDMCEYLHTHGPAESQALPRRNDTFQRTKTRSGASAMRHIGIVVLFGFAYL